MNSMKYSSLIIPSFIISVAASIIGAILKIMHLKFADQVLTISLLFDLLFVIFSIYEVRQTHLLSFREKTMWTVALIFFPGISGLIYILVRDRKINFNR